MLIQTNILTFKSNKIDLKPNSILYPVNAVGFNVRARSHCYTAGSDGAIQMWDYSSRTKIRQLNFLKAPVTCVKVNATGNLMAYGLGNDWHMGKEGIGMWPPRLHVHEIKTEELKK